MASLSSDNWRENSPNSLWSIALEFCALHPQYIFNTLPDGLFVTREDEILSRVICDGLLRMWNELDLPGIPRLLNAFTDLKHTDLKSIDLRKIVDLEDEDLGRLVRHRPIDLRVSSHKLTSESIRAINRNAVNLQTLHLGESSELFVNRNVFHDYVCTDFLAESLSRFHVEHVINASNLRTFGLNSLERDPLNFGYPSKLLNHALQGMSKLVRLDLSECDLDVVELGPAFDSLKNVMDLNLTNVSLEPLNLTLPVLGKVKSLRSLDVSQSLPDSQKKIYSGDIDGLMRTLLNSLPHLSRLDLAGTNLAGLLPPIPISHRPSEKFKQSVEQCAIPWMDQIRTLDYLGLLNCADSACDRENLPATQVTGDADESQILLSIKSYSHKKDLLLTALNNLFHVFKFAECTDHRRALEGIMLAMNSYVTDKAVQISGSASLFYVVKGELKHQFTTNIKKQLLQIILNGMEHHMDEPTMLRNGCLTLCHFTLPQDVFHCYERLVRLLHSVAVLTLPENENFVQRISIYLLNSLACQVDTKEKLLIGQLGAFKTMLRIIQERIACRLCDEVMEVAWSMMWNVTDETAENSERFINEQGMDIFLRCLEEFPDKEELLRNMMGLMGNVAEVDYLRPRLMKSNYVQIFSDLLSSASDGIEVSYNACGVLANLMSDGEKAWTIVSPSRSEVLHHMREAITRWKLDTKRNINYRSFKPILRLLPICDTPQVQHWAVWALCNLTKMYKSKYCPLLEREGGIELLSAVVNDPRPYTEIKSLVVQILHRCNCYKADPEYVSPDEDNEDDNVDMN